MVPDTSLQTLNHLLITLIVNYGVDCKFAKNKKKDGEGVTPWRLGIVV
jgi:hypothetical protein